MSWFNLSKDAIICKRCQEKTMNYPCTTCSFEPKRPVTIDGESYFAD